MVNELEIKPSIDTVMYVLGAILWLVDKRNLTKSALMKLADAMMYKNEYIKTFKEVAIHSF